MISPLFFLIAFSVIIIIGVSTFTLFSVAEYENPLICDNSLDQDYDGIPNCIDMCPTQREHYNGFQDADGCPDPDWKKVWRNLL